jgi:peptidoglycan hydrolase-like protein with peptidoglycan-binding domain
MTRKKLLTLFICLILVAIVYLPQAQASSQVRMVQQKLESLGFDPGPIDGKWGPRTRLALKDFQRVKELEVTGRLNANTKEALLSIQKWKEH